MFYNKLTKTIFCLLSMFMTMSALAANPAPANPAQKRVLDIAHWRTTNGAEVYFIPIHELPIIDIKIAFDAGSARDGAEFGIANFTNQMLSEGTARYSAEKLAETFDSFGALFANSSDQDMSAISLRSLTNPAYLDPVIDAFASVVTEPSFSPNDFARIQKQILLQIDDELQTPSTIADNAFFNAIYGNYPYAHSTLGKKEIVSKLEIKDLQKFYRDYYTGENAVIAIVGDVTREKAEQLANQITSKLPHGEAAAKLATPTYDPTKLVTHVSYPASQTFIRIGEISVKRGDPKHFPLMVGNYILGGGALTSRLFEEVREKRGLSYNVRSTLIPMKNSGVFMITLQTRNETAEEAIQLSKQVLSEFMNKGVKDQEIDSAKKNIIGSFFSALDSNSAISSNLLVLAFYQLPIDYFDTFRNKIAAVTKEQIENAFADTLNTKRMVTLTVGPSAENTKKTIANNETEFLQNVAIPVKL